jgi:hypothetical protein
MLKRLWQRLTRWASAAKQSRHTLDMLLPKATGKNWSVGIDKSSPVSPLVIHPHRHKSLKRPALFRRKSK